MVSETLICDTSFVGHLRGRLQAPERYAHWDAATVNRVEAAALAISVVTIAEVRAGYRHVGWGRRRVVEAEQSLGTYLRIFIDDPDLNEWARLSAAARARWKSCTSSRRSRRR